MKQNHAPPSPQTHSLQLTPQDRSTLLELAWKSIHHSLQHRVSASIPASIQKTLSTTLKTNGTSFITLEKHSQLRGCIGSLQAYRPLAQDVMENAFAAAFQDTRFPPLKKDELSNLTLSISILTPAETLIAESESHLLSQLTPHEDGLILQEGSHHSTFLPQVWCQLPDPSQFLQHLKRKAGLPADYWSPTLSFQRYHVEKINE